MYDKKTGYKNEYAFVKYLNKKKINELDPVSYDMIHKIYNNVNDNDYIKCWMNHYIQKGDIIISINGVLRSISIKMGAKNSVHVEHLHYFIKFLKENGMPYKVIKNYLEYHFADGTSSGTGNVRLSAEEYKVENQEKIDFINRYFTNKVFLIKCIDRFILKGNNCKYQIDGLIYGIPNDYMFFTKDEIIEILLSNLNSYSSGVHISSLFIQPLARDLKFTNKYDNDRKKIQVKWFNIFDDFMKYNMIKEKI